MEIGGMIIIIILGSAAIYAIKKYYEQNLTTEDKEYFKNLTMKDIIKTIYLLFKIVLNLIVVVACIAFLYFIILPVMLNYHNYEEEATQIEI